MLVSLKEILNIAQAKKIAIGSFNTPNLESLQAILGAAEELNQPVIIMHAQLHEDIGVCKLDEIGPIMMYMAEKSTVPVCVHLDHGTDFSYVKKALDIGFTSVMFDGSEGDVEENIANTSLVVDLAARFGASVEGEVGSMGERADGYGDHHGESVYTDPMLAQRFVKETIRRGIRKINYYSTTSKIAADVLSQKKYTQFHDAVNDAKAAIKNDVKNMIEVFTNVK